MECEAQRSQRAGKSIEPALNGVGDDHLLPPAVALGHIHAEEPGELGIGRDFRGHPILSATPAEEVAVAETVEQPGQLAGDPVWKLRPSLVKGHVADAFGGQQRCDGGAAGSRTPRATAVPLTISSPGAGSGTWSATRTTPSHPTGSGMRTGTATLAPGTQIVRANLRELSARVDGEQVVSGRDSYGSTRREFDLVDPIGRALVPTSDLVVTDLERVRIEGDDKSSALLANDLFDRTRREHPTLQHHHRLRPGKTRVDQEAETSERALSLDPRTRGCPEA